MKIITVFYRMRIIAATVSTMILIISKSNWLRSVNITVRGKLLNIVIGMGCTRTENVLNAKKSMGKSLSTTRSLLPKKELLLNLPQEEHLTRGFITH